MAEVGAAAHGIDALVAIVRYLLEVSDHVTTKGLRRVLHSAVGERSKEVIMTVGQRLIERGRQRGLEQGREEGIVLGQRALLLELLEERFGELPPQLTQRVAGATADDLHRWTRRFVPAKTLAEIFPDDE